MSDLLRPQNKEVAFIYDALSYEMKFRDSRDFEVWVKKERIAVFNAVNKLAEKLGVNLLTIDEVKRAENCAMGHSDYTRKFANGSYDILLSKVDR